MSVHSSRCHGQIPLGRAKLSKIPFPDHEMERPRLRVCQIERGGRIAVDSRSVISWVRPAAELAPAIPGRAIARTIASAGRSGVRSCPRAGCGRSAAEAAMEGRLPRGFYVKRARSTRRGARVDRSQQRSRSQTDPLPRRGDASFKQTALRGVVSLAFRLTNDAQRRWAEEILVSGYPLHTRNPGDQSPAALMMLR